MLHYFRGLTKDKFVFWPFPLLQDTLKNLKNVFGQKSCYLLYFKKNVWVFCSIRYYMFCMFVKMKPKMYDLQGIYCSIIKVFHVGSLVYQYTVCTYHSDIKMRECDERVHLAPFSRVILSLWARCNFTMYAYFTLQWVGTTIRFWSFRSFFSLKISIH